MNLVLSQEQDGGDIWRHNWAFTQWFSITLVSITLHGPFLPNGWETDFVRSLTPSGRTWEKLNCNFDLLQKNNARWMCCQYSSRYISVKSRVQYYAREFCSNAFTHSRRWCKLDSKLRTSTVSRKTKKGTEERRNMFRSIAVENNGSESALATDPKTLWRSFIQQTPQCWEY